MKPIREQRRFGRRQFLVGAGGVTLGLPILQPFQGGDIVVRIQTVPAGGTLWMGQVIAALPNAQNISFQTGFLQDDHQVINRSLIDHFRLQ